MAPPEADCLSLSKLKQREDNQHEEGDAGHTTNSQTTAMPATRRWLATRARLEIEAM
jgi:hypothetical protein